LKLKLQPGAGSDAGGRGVSRARDNPTNLASNASSQRVGKRRMSASPIAADFGMTYRTRGRRAVAACRIARTTSSGFPAIRSLSAASASARA
jgi:hypothetical protein